MRNGNYSYFTGGTEYDGDKYIDYPVVKYKDKVLAKRKAVNLRRKWIEQ